MNKEELNKKFGYNVEVYKELADVFELQEDCQDYAWKKLIEICRFMYNIDNENTNLKQALNEIREVVKGYMPTNQSVCKAMDEIEEIVDKVLGDDK